MPPLVFSIAFNGYRDVWTRCIASHQRYADRIEADYALLESDEPSPLLMESAWLKIPLLLAALRAGRDWVMFLDADAEVRDWCPDFRSVAEPGRDIFMSCGYSGRVNSGVIIARKTPSVDTLLAGILSRAGTPLPKADRVRWGENGEVIRSTRSYTGLKILPPEWNNNHSPDLPDFVRHYSAGPMRPLYELAPDEAAAKARAAERLALAHRRQDIGSSRFFEDLASLYDETAAHRSEFGALDVFVAAGLTVRAKKPA